MTRQRRKRPRHPAHPRYWPVWFAAALLWFMVRLPLSWQHVIGRNLGRIGHRSMPRRRRIARRNLELCLPDHSPTERDRMLRRHFEALGISVLESALACLRDPGALGGRLRILGGEHLQAALAGPNGVILAGGHFVTLEIVGALLARVTDLDVVYRPQGNPALERLQLGARRRHYARVIDRRDTRTMLQRLRAGHTLWIAGDQDPGVRHGTFIPFFGVAAATVTTTARLARLTGATVLLLDHWRDPAGMTWTARFTPPPMGFPGPDRNHDAALLNQMLEDAIREHPEQYLWLHRRFKSTPPGLPARY